MRTLVVFFSLMMPSLSALGGMIDNGDFTTDTESGLDWLDMSFTKGLSYDTVQAGMVIGGDFEGWRFATSAEFDTLMNNAIGQPYTIGSAAGAQFTGLVDLMGKMGSTIAESRNAYYTEIIEGSVDSSSLGYAQGRQFRYVDFTAAWEAEYGQVDVGVVHALGPEGQKLKAIEDPFRGSFLVRTSASIVPEPTAVSLWSVGLLGIVFTRRRIG